jgi:hypothetical protein
MTLDLQNHQKIFLTKRLADIEYIFSYLYYRYRVSIGANDRIQLASLVSGFVEVRNFAQN